MKLVKWLVLACVGSVVSCGGESTIGSGDELGSGGAVTKVGQGGGPASEVSCPCSRRPDANNSIKCAMGVGESATQRLGAAGGVVALRAQQGKASGVDFKIDVPPNTLPEDVAIQITETSHPPPVSLIDYSPIYQVEPAELATTFPIKLTLPFGGNDGLIPQTLAIYTAADPSGPFERISDSYTNAGFLQGSTKQLGFFMAGAPRTSEQSICP